MTSQPHWPGRLISLGDHEVYVASMPPAAVAQGAEPALAVHGLEGSRRNWTDLMALLGDRLDCDAVDLPGFGDSPPRPDGRYTIAAQAQTVIALIEKRGPVHLIGNSLGGAVCVKVAAARPELIKTLTLISPALPDPHPRMDLVRFPVMSVPWFGPRLARKLRTLPAERRVADVIATCFSDPRSFAPDRFAAEVTELTRRDALSWPPAVLVGSARTLTAESLRFGRGSAWRDVAKITAPALVIYGADDPLVKARMAGRAARAFRTARIVVMPRTGHLAHMEHPAVVAAEIRSLLDSARPGRNERRVGEFPVTSAG
jgi:pimeloyl-ACP methyl ester carboxylesterase